MSLQIHSPIFFSNQTVLMRRPTRPVTAAPFRIREVIRRGTGEPLALNRLKEHGGSKARFARAIFTCSVKTVIRRFLSTRYMSKGVNPSGENIFSMAGFTV
jgi:hypothetical protein